MNALLAVVLLSLSIAGPIGEVHPNGQDVWVDLGTPARMHIYYQTSRGTFDINWGPQEPGNYLFRDWTENDLTIDTIVFTAEDDLVMHWGFFRYFALVEAP